MGFTSWAKTVTGRLIDLSGDATVQGRERDRAKWWLVGLCNVIGYREGKVSVFKENPHQRIG
jgi:hypothetical protein